jgi:hypothetical protein
MFKPALVLTLVLAPAAAAQSFNIDCTDQIGVPPSTYAGAANQTGPWNMVSRNGPYNLTDTSGALTGASVWALGGNFGFFFDNPLTTGADGDLLDDITAGPFTYIFSGLADGNYDVYTYAFGPDSPGTLYTEVTIGTTTEVVGGVDWTGAHVEGETYALHQITVSGGSVTVLVDNSLAPGDASCNGFQFVQTGIICNNPVAYCTAGTSSVGCQAQIAATGTPSATAPNGFVLTATTVEAQKDGLFFYGVNGRQANPWGNSSSYNCVVPPVKRGGLLMGIGTLGSCNGGFNQDLNALWTANPAKNPGTGALVQAQLWYRDPFNTSNQTTSFSNAIEFTVCP